MREWQAQCPKRDTGKLDLVFPNGVGNVESIQNIYKRFWSPVEIKAGLTDIRPVLDDIGKPVLDEAGNPKSEPAPKFGFHALRHVDASLFIAYLGWTPKRVQQVMGHSSITVTYDTYRHLFQDKDADRDAMKKLEAAIAAA